MTMKEKTSDTHEDAWKRFERAVDVVVKSPPQHKTAKGTNRKPSKTAVKRGVSSKP